MRNKYEVALTTGLPAASRVPGAEVAQGHPCLWGPLGGSSHRPQRSGPVGMDHWSRLSTKLGTDAHEQMVWLGPHHGLWWPLLNPSCLLPEARAPGGRDQDLHTPSPWEIAPEDKAVSSAGPRPMADTQQIPNKYLSQWGKERGHAAGPRVPSGLASPLLPLLSTAAQHRVHFGGLEVPSGWAGIQEFVGLLLSWETLQGPLERSWGRGRSRPAGCGQQQHGWAGTADRPVMRVQKCLLVVRA